MNTLTRLSSSTAALLAAAALAAAPLEAQSCHRGRPLPLCRHFVITEAGYSMRLPTGPPLAQRHYINGEIGRMTNRPGGTAVGVSLFAGALVDYDFQLRVGITPRYRRWLGPRSSIDLSAGPMIAVVNGVGKGLGATSHVAWTLDDRFTILTQLEVTRAAGAEYAKGRSRDVTDIGWYLGARLGSKPATYAGLATAVLLGTTAILLAGR